MPISPEIYEYYQLCKYCITHDSNISKVVAPFYYNDIIAKSIYALKYNDNTAKAKFYSRYIYNEIIKENISFDLIIAVPLSYARMVKRKYNQSLLIARNLSRMSQVKLDLFSLKRIKNTIPQNDLNYQLRRNNVKDAFLVTNKNKITGKTILLIDDVVTTMATVEECARVLIESGAKSVIVAAIARVYQKK